MDKIYNPPLTIHQFHYSVTSGDAITNQMLFIQRALSENGIGGKIFSCQRNGLEKIEPYDRENIWDCDLLLVHHSQGNPALSEILRLEIPKALVYHNITPGHFYSHDPYIENLCRVGRDQLSEFNGIVASFCDSKFNAKELKNYGILKSELLPLFDLKDSKPSISKRPKKEFLFVGRLARHKNQALLIKTLFFLKQLGGKGSRLVLVGSGDPVYERYLKLLVGQLGLEKDVVFAGKVTDKELSQHYQTASAFICLSEHEGFCIPLVEAMRQDVPVFYLPEAATPETMGNAGVILKNATPEGIAHSVHAVLSDEHLVEMVLTSQRKRLKELREFQSAEGVTKALLPLVQKMRDRFHYRKKEKNEFSLPTF